MHYIECKQEISSMVTTYVRAFCTHSILIQVVVKLSWTTLIIAALLTPLFVRISKEPLCQWETTDDHPNNKGNIFWLYFNLAHESIAGPNGRKCFQAKVRNQHLSYIKCIILKLPTYYLKNLTWSIFSL